MTTNEKSASTREVPIAQIRLGQRVKNHRTSYNEAGLQELAASIGKNGLINPITVRPVGERYEVVAGHRRFLATSEYLDWETIAAYVKELTDEQAHAIMLGENVGREDLDPIDEAAAYQDSLDEYGWSIEQTAREAGTSADVVRRRLSLLKLIPELQQIVRQGNLALDYAERMTQLNDAGQRQAAKLLANSPSISPAAFSRYIGQLLDAQNQESMFDLTEFWMEQMETAQSWVASGKGANVPIVRSKDLPPVEVKPRTTTGDTMYDYMVALHQAGHKEAAAAVGNLLDALLEVRRVQLPLPPEHTVDA